jgi:hypothetical protein
MQTRQQQNTGGCPRAQLAFETVAMRRPLAAGRAASPAKAIMRAPQHPPDAGAWCVAEALAAWTLVL